MPLALASPPPLRRPRSRAPASQATTLAPQDAFAVPPDLLSHLAPVTRSAVRAIGRQRDYRAGQAMFQQGDVHDGIFLISGGLVRSYYVSEEGRELTLGFWSAGHYVGAPQVFGGGRHAWTSVAVKATQALWLPGRELRPLAQSHSDLAMALMDAMVQKSQCYCGLLQLMATHSMRVRLARLLNLLDEQGDSEPLALSHSQLASMVGSTRQWVSLSLARFESQGLVERLGSGTLRVLRADLLAQVN